MACAVLLLITIVLLLWYFNHPLSPYNARTTYIAAFEQVGPVSNGSNVQINGLHRGRILRMDKTDSLIYVHFEIISKIKIPVDSKVKFISAGFLGNREIYIELGTSEKDFNPKDTIRGSYDKGLSRASKDLEASIQILTQMTDDANAISDSLLAGENGKKIALIKKRGKRLISNTEADTHEWKKETSELFSAFSSVTGKAKDLLGKTGEGLDSAKQDLDSLNSQLNHLKESADSLQQKIQGISQTLNSDKGSAGAVIQENSELLARIDKLQINIGNLIKEIKKNGIKLNIDIF